MDRGLELFMAIHKDLTNTWEPPKIMFAPGVSDVVQLTELVKSHQGQVCTSEVEATHIIMPGGGPSPDESGNEYFRPLHVKGKMMTVHWWYYPDR